MSDSLKLLESINRNIKESIEGNRDFWGNVQVGDKVPTRGAGEVEILDLDRENDYVLVKRGAGYEPFVAAWAPELINGELTWGQGHYFESEEDARKYMENLK